MSRSLHASAGLLLVLATALSPAARAEVLKSADQGFSLRNAVTVAAAPATVWAALIEPARWWNPQHSWSGKAANFSLDARAGGCFCERLPDGGSVEHQRVLFVAPNRQLRLGGGLGPLQAEALSAVLNWELKAEGLGTRLTQTYVVGGHVDGGLGGWATPVDGVIREQLERLQRLIESGAPEAAPPAK